MSLQKNEDMGVHEVKHVSDPVRVYGITTEGSVKKKPEKSNLSETDKPSIVILPFENLTGDSEQDFLADGLRIDIQNALVKVSGVFLIAAGSANAYRGKPTAQYSLCEQLQCDLAYRGWRSSIDRKYR